MMRKKEFNLKFFLNKEKNINFIRSLSFSFSIWNEKEEEKKQLAAAATTTTMEKKRKIQKIGCVYKNALFIF